MSCPIKWKKLHIELSILIVVFVPVMRGPITKASLKKAWKDTIVALQDSEQDIIDNENDDDDFSAEGPSTEMAEGRAEENLVV